MNLKIARIVVKRPSFPRYPQDKKNRILIVKFDNGAEWVPSFQEMATLTTKLKEVYQWNLNNDLWVSKE